MRALEAVPPLVPGRDAPGGGSPLHCRCCGCSVKVSDPRWLAVRGCGCCVWSRWIRAGACCGGWLLVGAAMWWLCKKWVTFRDWRLWLTLRGMGGVGPHALWSWWLLVSVVRRQAKLDLMVRSSW